MHKYFVRLHRSYLQNVLIKTKESIRSQNVQLTVEQNFQNQRQIVLRNLIKIKMINRRVILQKTFSHLKEQNCPDPKISLNRAR